MTLHQAGGGEVFDQSYLKERSFYSKQHSIDDSTNLQTFTNYKQSMVPSPPSQN